jgi:molecular chaperone DnaK (HSP70)
MKQRRDKRDKCQAFGTTIAQSSATTTTDSKRTTRTNRCTTNSSAASTTTAYHKHKNDGPSGGVSALLPSLIGLAILVCGVMAKLGFRGRAAVCGIDLGTTNSVVCVQSQTTTTSSSSSNGKAASNTPDTVGWIECIADPATGSPVIPSVVSFLEASERQIGPSSKRPTRLNPHPSHVVVGQAAKRRIDSHPHHTLYNAKRVLGRSAHDPAVAALASEVEFGVEITAAFNDSSLDNVDDALGSIAFRVPDTPLPISPRLVGSYIINHLVRITESVLGHANVKSAVICVPAKFNAHQRRETVAAVTAAGLTVTRIVEEPTAAALAYGLHRKAGVNYILVYDFGGGTLDISVLHVSDGYVDVMGSDGDDRLGGTDFDVAIAHHLLHDTNADERNDSRRRHSSGGGSDGRSVIQIVAKILQQIQSQQRTMTDLEDVLSSKCPALQDTPLCSISSFHTVGEQLKIQLSDAYTPGVESTAKAECLGIPEEMANNESWTLDLFCSSLRPVPLVLTSSDFERVVQPLLERSIVPVIRLLKALELTAGDVDEIVMVGGTTRMPQVRHLVQAAFPDSQLNTRIDPDITVAYGAASVID